MSTDQDSTQELLPAQDGDIIQDKKEQKTVICKLCLRSIKYSGNTTNLHFHLKEHQRSTYSSLPVTGKERGQAQSST